MTGTSLTAGDPRRLMGAAALSPRQVVAIIVCIALNALDGFDVLSISFASKGIAGEWHINKAALGVVLSVDLVGMVAGSVVLGQVADRIGRRAVMLGCLALMALGMLATTQVSSIGTLAATRLMTGLGIGGMFAATNALAAEYANDRWRGAAVALMAAGYPLGAIIGGNIAGHILATGGWRGVFMLGAQASALLLPLAFVLMPEPVSFLMQRRREGAGALAQVNRSLKALGHPQVAALPDAPREAAPTPLAALFAPALRPLLLVLTLAYFAHIMTFYFLLKWLPSIVGDLGFAPALASSVVVWANVGGLTGALVFSVLSLRVGLRPLVAGAMLAGGVLVAGFGLVAAGALSGGVHASLAALDWAAGAADFFINAAIVGLYALVASSFPTAVRAGATGVVVGLGRCGAAVGPMVAGVLFQSGLGVAPVAAIMGCGSVSASLLLAVLGRARRTGSLSPV